MFERIEWAYARLDTAAEPAQAQARLKLEKFDLVIGDESAGLRELVLETGAFDLVAKDGLDEAALQRFLRLANAHAAGSVRSLRRREARFRKTFELARCQEALGRFGQAALALREPAELIDEAVRTVTHAVAAREACYIEAGDPSGASAALVDVLHCGVHYVCDGTCIVPVRREGEVRGALSAQGEGIGVETLPFLDTLASLLSTALQRIDSERKLSFLAQFDASRGSRARGHLALELSARSSATSFAWCTSRRSTCARAARAAPRRCCAGSIPSAACSRRRNSCPCSRKPASSCRSGSGSSRGPART